LDCNRRGLTPERRRAYVAATTFTQRQLKPRRHSMAVKIAINGFGRIGRCVLRAALSRKEDIEIVAINDLDKPSALAHLFKYDSVHRTWPGTVKAAEKGLSIDGKEISLTAEKDPAALPWKAHGVDVVLE